MDELEGLRSWLPEGIDEGALRSLADSPEAKRLGEAVDGAAARALQQGDADTLKAILGTLLATPEGKALAEKLSALGGQT